MRSLAGRYRVEDPVGRGGSAVVHRGFDRTLKRTVAIKLFSPYRPGSEEPAVDVLREARAAAGLNHPNVARVYDYGEATEGGEQVPYLVMEFLEGDTLADELARTGALEWPQAVAICADTAAALAAAHGRNLVHRDVKARNVMLTPNGVKVLDFGIAAVAGQSSLDTHGRLWGTPANLAPEQLRGEPTFPAADVYALGLLLFECLTGSRAWPGTSVGEILAARHVGRTPRLPRIAGLPREIVRLYEDCTAEAADRRPSAAAAAEILRRAIGKVPTVRPAVALVTTIPAPRRARSRRRAAVTASMAVATAFVSILGLQVANGVAAPHGRQAEAAAEGAAGGMTQTPQVAPRPTSTDPIRDVPTEGEQPVRKPPAARIQEVMVPPGPTAPTTAPVNGHPTTAPTTRPTPGQTTGHPTPTTTTKPTTDPTQTPTVTPTTETTKTPDPTTPTTPPTLPPASTPPPEVVVLADTAT
ncbi:serine/threonine-protein kinase [Actinoplanes sp. NPDC051346]|uniref:serine/threonine-protein kinase n=1 Tax=Actinoplanes sp. NPDC051346 TaxID=3155048 RepID=UPI00342E9886